MISRLLAWNYVNTVTQGLRYACIHFEKKISITLLAPDDWTDEHFSMMHVKKFEEKNTTSSL